MKTLLSSAALLLTLLFSTCTLAGNKADVEFLNQQPSSKQLPFSEAVRVGNMLILSGKIGFDPKTKALAKGGLKAEAHQTLASIKRTLNAYGYTMNQVVKCTVMLVDINDFKAFNEVYTQHFEPPYPARSAFAVKALALNSQVEVECMAAI